MQMKAIAPAIVLLTALGAPTLAQAQADTSPTAASMQRDDDKGEWGWLGLLGLVGLLGLRRRDDSDVRVPRTRTT
jgi:MYXO-CTERM domain-containing protein